MQHKDNVMGPEDYALVNQMVVSLLNEKPADPVPFIYNFLAQKKAGVANPVPLTNIEVQQIKNLRL
jgi:hypothetical protein